MVLFPEHLNRYCWYLDGEFAGEYSCLLFTIQTTIPIPDIQQVCDEFAPYTQLSIRAHLLSMAFLRAVTDVVSRLAALSSQCKNSNILVCPSLSPIDSLISKA